MSEPVRIPHFIQGQRTHGVGERTSPVFNPATGEQTGTLGLAAQTDVDAAVASAKAAFPAWAATSPSRRARVMF
ncbi:MAG TPA: aldehyde dehydrogenase family protein, partial [Patescibacteria group bacterium]|nr:aldehyde dehydrogenase family protein [Patescibacteria group bacterium]